MVSYRRDKEVMLGQRASSRRNIWALEKHAVLNKVKGRSQAQLFGVRACSRTMNVTPPAYLPRPMAVEPSEVPLEVRCRCH